jgi:hypothetical protein
MRKLVGYFLPFLFLIAIVTSCVEVDLNNLLGTSFNSNSPKTSRIKASDLPPGQLYTQLTAARGSISSAGSNTYIARVDINQSHLGKYLFPPTVSPPLFISTTFTYHENFHHAHQYVYINYLNSLYGIQANDQNVDKFTPRGVINYFDSMTAKQEDHFKELRIPSHMTRDMKGNPNVVRDGDIVNSYQKDLFKSYHNTLAIFQDDKNIYVFINGKNFTTRSVKNVTPGQVGIAASKSFTEDLDNNIILTNTYLATDLLALGFYNALNNSIANTNNGVNPFDDTFDVNVSGSLNKNKSRSVGTEFELGSDMTTFQTIDTSVVIKPIQTADLHFPLYINVTYTLILEIETEEFDEEGNLERKHILQKNPDLITTYNKQYYVKSPDTIIQDKFPIEFFESLIFQNIFGKIRATLVSPPKITAYVTGIHSFQ